MVRAGTRGWWSLRSAAVAGVALLTSAACAPGASDTDAAGPTTSRRTSTTASVDAATSSTAPASSSTSTPPTDLRRVDLAARPHRVRCPGGEVELQPGVAAPGADARPVVIDSFEPQFLDLTGDGRPEAVVEVACRVADEWSTGVRSVIVLADQAGEVVQLGQPLDGADPTVVGSSLAVGRATDVNAEASTEASTEVSTDAAGAATSTPTSIVYEPFSFDGSSWVPGSDGTAVQPGDPVTVDGIGPVLVGAPFGEVAISTGEPIEVEDQLATGGACVELVFPSGPEGVGGLGGDGVVHAVHVDNPAIRTGEGLGVGSTEVEVQYAFPDQVSVLPHPYVPGGHQLIVDFPDLPDRVLLFNTDGTTVTDFAAGAAGWADLAEGCA